MKIGIIGAGGQGKIVGDIAKTLDYKEIYYFDSYGEKIETKTVVSSQIGHVPLVTSVLISNPFPNNPFPNFSISFPVIFSLIFKSFRCKVF